MNGERFTYNDWGQNTDNKKLKYIMNNMNHDGICLGMVCYWINLYSMCNGNMADTFYWLRKDLENNQRFMSRKAHFGKTSYKKTEILWDLNETHRASLRLKDTLTDNTLDMKETGKDLMEMCKKVKMRDPLSYNDNMMSSFKGFNEKLSRFQLIKEENETLIDKIKENGKLIDFYTQEIDKIDDYNSVQDALSSFKGMGKYKAEKKTNAIDDTKGWYVITGQLKNNIGGHAVGLIITNSSLFTGKNYWFFDPNFGIYNFGNFKETETVIKLFNLEYPRQITVIEISSTEKFS
jgi:hypothetical protein